MYRQILMGILILVNSVVLNASSREAFSMEQPSGVEPASITIECSLPPVPTASPIPTASPSPSPSPAPSPGPSPIPVEEETRIVISFAGDCTLGTDPSFRASTSFPARLRQQNGDYSYFFKGVRSVFSADDLTLVNLETTLTTATRMAAKKFRFKGDPSYVKILQEGGIEMVNIANNHIHDFLEQGYRDTLKVLQEGKILYGGEGNTALATVKGIRVMSLGYTGWDLSQKKRIREDLEKARKAAELVVVSFHWGEERVHSPNSIQKELGRFCIDQGADIVVGHHPHVLQGVEQYKGRFIVYSLGNFCFGGNSNPRDKDTMIFQGVFCLRGKEIKEREGQILPCSISSIANANNYQPILLEGKEAERVENRIYKYSSLLEFGIRPPEKNVDGSGVGDGLLQKGTQ